LANDGLFGVIGETLRDPPYWLTGVNGAGIMYALSARY
jgi:hypothetical protein